MAVKVKYRGDFMTLEEKPISCDELQSLYDRTYRMGKEYQDDLAIHLIPTANRVIGRYKRYFHVVPMEDMAGIAYAALPGALAAFDSNRGKGRLRNFTCIHVSGMVWSSIRTACRKKRIMPSVVEPDDDFDYLDFVADPGPSPDELAQQSIDYALVSDFLGRRLRGNQKQWRYLARYYGVEGRERASAPEIGREEGLTKMAVHNQINHAIQTIRKELNVA